MKKTRRMNTEMRVASETSSRNSSHSWHWVIVHQIQMGHG